MLDSSAFRGETAVKIHKELARDVPAAGTATFGKGSTSRTDFIPSRLQGASLLSFTGGRRGGCVIIAFAWFDFALAKWGFGLMLRCV